MERAKHRLASILGAFFDDSGQDLTEYMMLLAMLSVGIVSVAPPLAAKVLNIFTRTLAIFP